LILLLGAQVGFYLQFPQYMTRRPLQLHLSGRLREYLALQVMYLVAFHHMNQKEPWTLELLVHHLGVPMQPVHRVLGVMVEAGFLSETADELPAYLPRRDVETIKLSDLLDVARSAGETNLLALETLHYEKQVSDTLESIQQAVTNELGDRTLRDMVKGNAQGN